MVEQRTVNATVGCSNRPLAAMKNQYSLEEVLVENSTYNRTRLKKRLIDEGLLRNECHECRMLPIWNNKPLTLQLEHKNGINNDNRLENLELLCPNCHSQTETFAGRNSKMPDPKCLICNKKLSSRKNKYCKSHYPTRHQPKPDRRKITWPSIEELEEMKSQMTWVDMGECLGVSDNAVRSFYRRRKREQSEVV